MTGVPGRKSLSLLIIILLCFLYFTTPVEVEGLVESKAINGKMSGDIVEGILENRPFPGEPWILVESEDFERFFSPEEKNVYINDSLKELLERKYVSVNYDVAIQLSSDDPVNDVPEGETCTYLVSPEDFNKVKIGDKVECKVSRHRFVKIDKITVL